jgi:hypothetical protein
MKRRGILAFARSATGSGRRDPSLTSDSDTDDDRPRKYQGIHDSTTAVVSGHAIPDEAVGMIHALTGERNFSRVNRNYRSRGQMCAFRICVAKAPFSNDVPYRIPPICQELRESDAGPRLLAEPLNRWLDNNIYSGPSSALNHEIALAVVRKLRDATEYPPNELFTYDKRREWDCRTNDIVLRHFKNDMLVIMARILSRRSFDEFAVLRRAKIRMHILAGLPQHHTRLIISLVFSLIHPQGDTLAMLWQTDLTLHYRDFTRSFRVQEGITGTHSFTPLPGTHAGQTNMADVGGSVSDLFQENEMQFVAPEDMLFPAIPVTFKASIEAGPGDHLAPFRNSDFYDTLYQWTTIHNDLELKSRLLFLSLATDNLALRNRVTPAQKAAYALVLSRAKQRSLVQKPLPLPPQRPPPQALGLTRYFSHDRLPLQPRDPLLPSRGRRRKRHSESPPRRRRFKSAPTRG